MRADRLGRRLSAPIDARALAYFRIVFGVVAVWRMLGYTFGKKLVTNYEAPSILFKHRYFEWIPLLPHGALVSLVWAMLIAGVLVVAGKWARPAAVAYGLGSLYLLMVSLTVYNNHDYLISLLALLCGALPVDHAWVISSKRPSLATVPLWSLWLLRFEIGLPYFMGFLPKINADWLFRAQPMRLWLADGRAKVPFGLGWMDHDALAYALSWGGFFFDLLVVPALLFKGTRIIAVLVLAGFHLSNSQMFNIGVFPWLMLFSTPLFFPPSWPEKLRLTRAKPRRKSARRVSTDTESAETSPAVLAVLALTVLVQVAVPQRHYLYPGVVDWTGDGLFFSWRMKIFDKTGVIDLFLVDASGRVIEIEGDYAALTHKQWEHALHYPQVFLQYVHFVGEALRRRGAPPMQIRARSSISFNGRPRQPLVDEGVDLLSIDLRTPMHDWMMPLRPLEGR